MGKKQCSFFLDRATAESRCVHLLVIVLFYLILTFVYTPETIIIIKIISFSIIPTVFLYPFVKFPSCPTPAESAFFLFFFFYRLSFTWAFGWFWKETTPAGERQHLLPPRSQPSKSNTSLPSRTKLSLSLNDSLLPMAPDGSGVCVGVGGGERR